MLNEKQMIAVSADDRFILLIAGAGSGKTRVIVSRVKRLVGEGVKPEKILLISFTKKNTIEMKQRLSNIKGTPFITTFHGFCYQMLKSQLTSKIVIEEDLVGWGYTKDELRQIDILKRHGSTSKKLKVYNRLLKKQNRIDFTDLEMLMIKKLAEDDSFRKHITNLFDYIFIDEFQDTSTIQFKLLKQLTSKTIHIFCVGDPDQSIYSFRGASSRVLKDYVKFFKPRVLYLDINYRSNKNIVNLSNNLINHNKRDTPKNLQASRETLGDIEVKYFKDDDSQNAFIIKEIRHLLSRTLREHDIAILYRNHYVANTLKEALYHTYIEGLNILTIHQAKGLEFKVVFIIGLNENILPMQNVLIEEERRLFYVAVTRAKESLYLCSNLKSGKPSRFIHESIKL